MQSYFVAIDAGLTPSVETLQAFESRKFIYLGHVNEKGSHMAGPIVDYHNPLNVRLEVKRDLELANCQLSPIQYVVKVL